MKILLKAAIKQHKGGLAGIFLLVMSAFAALSTALIIWSNSDLYIQSEMQRAGFGSLTAWVSGVPDDLDLAGSIEAIQEIEKVEAQDIIYSDYTIKGQESDSEGQMILYKPEENRYRFFTEDLSGYKRQPDAVMPGETYVSPSIISMFGASLGDEITFPIARSGKNITLTIKGFYEDPFMGSSMIGMKGFLISESDRSEALLILKDAGIDALARNGSMLHIFPKEEMTASELNSLINEQSAVGEYSEDVHSDEAVAGFMTILQDAFSGLLTAFSAVLLLVVIVAVSHSVSSTIEADTVNMGILKTVGFTSYKLRRIQIYKYMIPVIPGMFLGVVLSMPLSRLASGLTLTAAGVRIPVKLPTVWTIISFAVVLILLIGFVLIRTGKIAKIRPIQTIRSAPQSAPVNLKTTFPAFGKGMYFRLAFRRLISGKHRYISALAVAVILVFFASLTGRMDSWLGAGGEGMMEAFNPADHDIGVQSFGSLTWEEFENVIRSYTEITDTYELAMPSVAVNGVDYTANVIDQPSRFHILQGKTCMADNEIVLTEFVAAAFGVGVNDTVTVSGDSGSGEYTVSGIYSCANDMGDNVGMSRGGYLKIAKDNPNLWCRHYFLQDASYKGAIAQDLENAYGGDIHVHENTWPGLFGIISAMRALMILMYIMTAVFILVVTVMTGSRILSAEQKDLSIYRAVGFRVNALRLSFAIRFGMIALLGCVIGIILASLLTDPLVSSVMKLAGISNFASSPSLESVLLPAAAVITLFMCFAYIVAGRIKKDSLTVLISE